jgi:hypothetical protein
VACSKGVEYPIMNLSEDTDVFAEMVEMAAQDFGLPQVYIEKDYWVTKALLQLSESPEAERVVFKGGLPFPKRTSSFIGFLKILILP